MVENIFIKFSPLQKKELFINPHVLILHNKMVLPKGKIVTFQKSPRALLFHKNVPKSYRVKLSLLQPNQSIGYLLECWKLNPQQLFSLILFSQFDGLNQIAPKVFGRVAFVHVHPSPQTNLTQELKYVYVGVLW